MAHAAFKVVVHRRSGTTTHSLAEGEQLVLGRDPDCAVKLSDGRVSRRHAVLQLRAGVIEVVDLGSRNGSFVDGNRAAANTPSPVQETSVVRVGEAVLVFERAQSSPASTFSFDLEGFRTRASSMLADAKRKGRAVGLIDIRWDTSPLATITTVNDTAPVGLQQVLARIVGSQGVVGAYDNGRLVLLLGETARERLDESAAQVTRICSEHGIRAELNTALSTPETRTLDALLAQRAQTGGVAVPPFMFRGGLRSIDTLLAKLEASDAPVLIVGETGVGKDVLARSLHVRSKRASKPLVALNCAAFTDTLFESELFGHERGAFTGAQQAKTGLLESAAGGTVFLDEIGEMPLGMQAKLLRVVENREILRVGALQPKPIDVRFIFATNRDLRSEIERGTFRRDLFYRIASITLTVPPLRERVDEIGPLAQFFADVAARRLGAPEPRFLPETLRFLEGHAWPGNVRELRNVIDLAVLVHEGDAIRPADVPIERYVTTDAPKGDPLPESLPQPQPQSQQPAANGEPTEKERILAALEACVWNQSSAAKLLGMPRRTLVKRLAQYDLPRPRKRD